MAYTVKELSKLSGVTVRTLHYYEEEGLLKPAYYGSNGYRYYEEKELLQLQQILFFKELGFTLKKIKSTLGKDDFNQLSALHSHKRELHKEWVKMGILLKTIDKTINHLEGRKNMKEQELFEGFIVNKADKNKSYFKAEEIIGESIKKPKLELSDEEKQNLNESIKPIFTNLATCFKKGMKSDSVEVQANIKKYVEKISQFSEVTKDVCLAYAQLYREHPDFEKYLNSLAPKFNIFISKALTHFAQHNL